MTEGDVDVVGVSTRVEDPKDAVARAQAFARERGGWAQLLDAGRVVGRDHLVSAVEHARRAFSEGTNAASSIEIEFLLYASGERQIARAIERIGVRRGRPFAAVLVGGPRGSDLVRTLGWTQDDRLLAPRPAKLRALGFSPREIAAAGTRAGDLALERVARVDLEK